MADKVMNSVELNIQLLSADGLASRIIKIDNPKLFDYDEARAVVEAAFSPCWGRSSSDTSTAKDIFFFYDDNDKTVPMTQIGTIEQVSVVKTIRRYD